MTREQNQLIKKLKSLTPDDIARVQQFLEQLKSPDLRGVRVELKAVQGELKTVPAEPRQAERAMDECATADTAVMADAASGPASVRGAAGHPAPGREAIPETSPEAEVAHAACAQWRRRPFQAIDADDLQPIAALFREAVDIRAASRFRFGGSR